jgi:hypothetical protein
MIGVLPNLIKKKEMEFLQRELQMYYYVLSYRPFWLVLFVDLAVFWPSGNPELCTTMSWSNSPRGIQCIRICMNSENDVLNLNHSC